VAAPQPIPTDAGGAVSLLYALALLAVILITTVGLLLALRRGRALRRNAHQRANSLPSADPWSEAGRRMPTPIDPDETPRPAPEDDPDDEDPL